MTRQKALHKLFMMVLDFRSFDKKMCQHTICSLCDFCSFEIGLRDVIFFEDQWRTLAETKLQQATSCSHVDSCGHGVLDGSAAKTTWHVEAQAAIEADKENIFRVVEKGCGFSQLNSNFTADQADSKHCRGSRTRSRSGSTEASSQP